MINPLKKVSKMKNAKQKSLYQVKVEEGKYTVYIATAEVTKYVKSLLGIKFPGVKFSVRKSPGGSVDISWVLGAMGAITGNKTTQDTTPEAWQRIRREESDMVNAVVRHLHGEGFDGMTDCRYSRKHYLLPNGEIQYAGCDAAGTTVTSESLPMPEGAREVHLFNSFIFCQPSYS